MAEHEVQVEPSPDEHGIRFMTGTLQRIEVRPGDKFVLQLQHNASDEQIHFIRMAWEDFAGLDAPLLILDGDVKLGVLSTPGKPQEAE